MKFSITAILLLWTVSIGLAQSAGSSSTSQQAKILMVVSNAGYYGESDIMTSNHFSELVVPYDEFVSAGYVVDLVSPQGGRVPIGYINTSDPMMAKYIHNSEFIDMIDKTKKPKDIIAADYKAIFYVGGGAAMFGVPQDKAIQNLAIDIYEKNGGVVAAICHGTAGLVNLKTSDGEYLVKGKKVNGFPDLFENKDAEYFKQFPFSIQEAIGKNGGDFVYSEEGWDKYYVIDGRVASGQDPSSAKILARKIIDMLGVL